MKHTPPYAYHAAQTPQVPKWVVGHGVHNKNHIFSISQPA